MGLNLDQGNISIGIAVWKWGATWAKKGWKKACARASLPSRATTLNAVMTKAKITGNYPNSMMAKTDALRHGFDEAIMLDPNGYVAECTGENLFLVRNGTVITPPMAPVLEGITRDSLMQIARHLGIEVVEQQISRDQLYIADEIFVCGTAAEVCAIREIDFRTIGPGNGPGHPPDPTAYQDAVHGRHPLSADWLDYVSTVSGTNRPDLADMPARLDYPFYGPVAFPLLSLPFRASPALTPRQPCWNILAPTRHPALREL